MQKQLAQLIESNTIDSYNIEASDTVVNDGVIVKVRLTVFKDKLPQYATGFAYGSSEDITQVADQALQHAFHLLLANF